MRTPTAVVVGIVAVSVMAGIVVACSDGGISPVDRRPRPTASEGLASSSRSALAAELHRTNRMDWVGQAHSRGLDHFRQALRSKRIKKGQLCKALPAILAEDDARLPGHRTESRDKIEAATREEVKLHELCGARRTAVLSPPPRLSPPSTHGSHAASIAVTPAAQGITVEGLLEQITNAASVATTSGGLAASLSPIAAQVATLDPVGQDVVLASASLALSSAEYWEANRESFYYEVTAATSGNPCTNGETCEAEYSVVRAPMLLPPQTVWQGFAIIVGADVTAFVAQVSSMWILGPIAWEVAAARAVGASLGAGVSLILKNLWYMI
jgi:hypothetical protein